MAQVIKDGDVGKFCTVDVESVIQRLRSMKSELDPSLREYNLYGWARIMTLTGNGEKYGIQFFKKIWAKKDETKQSAVKDLHGRGRKGHCLYIEKGQIHKLLDIEKCVRGSMKKDYMLDFSRSDLLSFFELKNSGIDHLTASDWVLLYYLWCNSVQTGRIKKINLPFGKTQVRELLMISDHIRLSSDSKEWVYSDGQCLQEKDVKGQDLDFDRTTSDYRYEIYYPDDEEFIEDLAREVASELEEEIINNQKKKKDGKTIKLQRDVESVSRGQRRTGKAVSVRGCSRSVSIRPQSYETVTYHG